MGMTVAEIKSKIGRRVGDPELQTYDAETQDYFEQAFAMLLKKTDNGITPTYLNEIRPSLDSREATVIPGDYFLTDITITNAMFPDLLKIYYIDTTVGNYNTFKFVDINLVNAMSRNSNVPPEAHDGYWGTDGQIIRLFLNTTASYKVRIKYIRNPRPDEWESLDLVNDIGYGYGFISDCIETAASLLRRQIGVEE